METTTTTTTITGGGTELPQPQIVDVGSIVEAVSGSTDDAATDAPLYEVESLCLRCSENCQSDFAERLCRLRMMSKTKMGVTRLLLTVIPHFRKILLAAFECPHCGESLLVNSSLEGVTAAWKFHQMLNRQVVKSESATIKIPELDFEIPPEAQRGSLSTVEGALVRAADELEALQEERRKLDPQTADAIDQFLIKLRACAMAKSSFTFILDDPCGNSFIENPFAPSLDPSLTSKFYERTPEQQASLGYLVDPSESGEAGDVASLNTSDGPDQTQREPHGSVGARAGRRAIAQGNSTEIAEALFQYSTPEEVMTFPSTCGACAAKCECRMFVTNIPYFQEVIVMASSCDSCGYRNSEVKPGASIPPKGKKIAVHVENVKDLSRDVIKILREFMALLLEISLDSTKRSKWQEFRARLNKLLSLEEPWTLIIDDALANSFGTPATDNITNDHQLAFEVYERSWEQKEELGLNDMDTSSADVAYNTVDANPNGEDDV